MDLFPYPFRSGQRELVDFLREAAVAGRAAVVESGTGTGKTVSSLAASIDAAKSTGCKVIYLTRTKSQHRQVVTECARISEKVPLLCVPLQGRKASTCPMMADDPELSAGTPEELSKLCSEYKRKENGVSTCRYYENIENADMTAVIDYIRSSHPTQEEFNTYCEKRDLCPYELMKHALPEADVIVAPYPFVFMPAVLRHFIEWAGVPLSSMIAVVDEAHNLPDYLREVMTAEYGLNALALAEKEAREWGDPEVAEGFTVTDLTGVFRDIIVAAADEYLVEEDGLVPPHFLQDELMERLGMSSRTISAMQRALVDIGETVSESKKKRRKLPRTYIGSLGRFLQHWYSTDEGFYVRLVVGGDNTKLKVYCMDPREASWPLYEFHASIHMSGTLAPLEEYVTELGLEDAEARTFRSPFDPGNLMVEYVTDVSTKYDEMSDAENVGRIEQHTVDIVRCTERNAAVFFPSYKLMDSFIRDGVPERIGRDIFYEVRGMSQTDLMEAVEGFRSTPHGVLFAVTGGRISEGLDFPDKDLEVAVIIGIPYPRPTARHKAFTRYCEIVFGDGFEHASKIPAARKIRQAIGRLIRSEDDAGAAVILDRRASALDGIDAVAADDPCSDIARFFGGREQN